MLTVERITTYGALALAVFTLGACGAGAGGVSEELRSLPEQRALQVIRETCTDASVESGGAFVARLPSRDDALPEDLEVDLRIGTAETALRLGVEWVSRQDRTDGVDIELPPQDQLRIVVSSTGAQVLVLDERSYRFSTSRRRVEAGAAGTTDVDARIRRDVRDFLVYAGLRSP